MGRNWNKDGRGWHTLLSAMFNLKIKLVMEFLNKVELEGVVGNVDNHSMSHSSMVTFSLATNTVFKDNTGGMCCDVMWFRVTKVYAQKEPMLQLKKGDYAHVVGRLAAEKYVGEDGVERQTCKVIAQSVKRVN